MLWKRKILIPFSAIFYPEDKEKNMYLITYDIREAKRLKKTALLLQKYGRRVQKSVFECEIDEKKHDQLWKQLLLLSREEDHISSYFLTSCHRKRELGSRNL